MPELFRIYGFVFYFFSREHEPIHVHVRGKGGTAKYNLDNGTFVLGESAGLTPRDLRVIQSVIDENTDVIINHWHHYFYGE